MTRVLLQVNRVALEFRPADPWIGASVRAGSPVKSYLVGTMEYRFSQRIDLWVCLVPMLPIHIWWERAVTPPAGRSS